MKQQRWWSPALLPAHLLLIACVSAATWLGFWQFSGWQDARERASHDLTMVEPIPLTEAFGPDDPFPADALGRPVVVEGTWVTGSTVYVTGRHQDGQDGSWAVTPLAIRGPDEPALLVVRGFMTALDSPPAPPSGEARMVVWLQPPEGRIDVRDDDPTDDRIPQLRMADAVQHVDQDLYSGFGVVADRVAEGNWPVGDQAENPGTAGLDQVQPPEQPKVDWTTSARNFFYGVEWWVFGVFALIVWWQFVRDRVREQRDDTTDAVPSNS